MPVSLKVQAWSIRKTLPSGCRSCSVLSLCGLVLDFSLGVAVFLQDLEEEVSVEGAVKQFFVQNWVESSRKAGAVELQIVAR